MENNDWLQIENGVLRHCSIDATGDIIIPNNVTMIGAYAFNECTKLTSIVIPDSVTCIDIGAFEKCIHLTSITIPDSVTSIRARAFYSCESLTSIKIPKLVTKIAHRTFKYCSSLTTINIPNGITSIEEGAFYGCTNLISITIPSSVINIGRYVFNRCCKLFNYPKDGDKIIAYKGFKYKDNKFTCRNRKYSLMELNTEPEVKICECGIHACLLPIDVLNYYDVHYHDEYCIYKVELSGKFDYNYTTSKICATEMKIIHKIFKNDLIKETIKMLNNKKL